MFIEPTMWLLISDIFTACFICKQTSSDNSSNWG